MADHDCPFCTAGIPFTTKQYIPLRDPVTLLPLNETLVLSDKAYQAIMRAVMSTQAEPLK